MEKFNNLLEALGGKQTRVYYLTASGSTLFSVDASDVSKVTPKYKKYFPFITKINIHFYQPTVWKDIKAYEEVNRNIPRKKGVRTVNPTHDGFEIRDLAIDEAKELEELLSEIDAILGNLK